MLNVDLHQLRVTNDPNFLTPFLSHPQKTDSGDSGNEEPCAEQDFYVKPPDEEAAPGAAMVYAQAHAHAQTSRVAPERVLPPTPKVDRLAERINNLSLPREYAAEKVPEGLVDSLPPEGGAKFDLVQLCVCACVCVHMESNCKMLGSAMKVQA